jgi:predicted ATP-grasp superfamily ATP-dependent carboligase
MSALRAGFSPWCADLFADADLAQIADARNAQHYPHDLPSLIAAAPPAPWMYTGAVENSPEIVANIAAGRELWGNDASRIARVRDPATLTAVLQRHGYAAPAIATSPAELACDGSWLVKRLRSAGGQHVQPWIGQAGFGDTAAHYWQERAAGAPCSAVFVAANRSSYLLGATRQLIGEPWTGTTGFRYAGSLGPLPTSHELEASLQNLGDILAEEFRLVGLFGVDFLLDGETVRPIEVNPRYTASIEVLERATGLCAIRWHALACRDGHLPRRGEIRLTADRLHGKAILFASEKLSVSRELSERLLRENASRQWPHVADIPVAGSCIERGWPVATVFGSGESEGALLAELQHRMSALRAQSGIRISSGSA